MIGIEQILTEAPERAEDFIQANKTSVIVYGNALTMASLEDDMGYCNVIGDYFIWHKTASGVVVPDAIKIDCFMIDVKPQTIKLYQRFGNDTDELIIRTAMFNDIKIVKARD